MIAEQDELLRDSMRILLEEAHYAVTEVGSGEEAKSLFEKSPFDVVIANVDLKPMDGVKLLVHIKSSPSARFLLLSSADGTLTAEQALNLGADEFLFVPFGRDQFKTAVETALTKTRSDASVDVTDYVPVPIDEFVTGSVLKMDLFLRISPKKFIKIGNQGTILKMERMRQYTLKGLRNLHMRKADFADYVGFNMAISRAAHSHDAIENAKKLKLTKHTIENLIDQLCRDGIARERLDDACNVVFNTVELVMSNDATFKLLESMELSGSQSSHSVAVAVWACLIAKKLGWTGQTTFFKVALCALFHDIGMKELPPELAKKQRFEMSPAETKIYEGHTLRGRDILTSVPNMPEDVGIVSAQHHERVRGGGYPYGLKMEHIHPMAKLISVADSYCDLIRTSTEHQAVPLGEIYQMLCQNHRDFDTAFLKALGEIVYQGPLPATA